MEQPEVTLNLDLINNQVNKLEKIDDLDIKLEEIKLIRNNLQLYQSKINKYKNDIDNENNYNIAKELDMLTFQQLKKLFENKNQDIDNKLKIYQTYSKKLIQLEDELFKDK
tara:strand:- start:234 stop:566 length:333 start_codon:yes stop_codon:yes gene_type:complete